MTLPTFDQLLLPLLTALKDGRERSMRELREFTAKALGVSDTDRRVTLPGGNGFTFDNRVGWARTYLRKAGLVSLPRRGFAQISERGREWLTQTPGHLTLDDLKTFPEFLEFLSHMRANQNDGEDATASTPEGSSATPEEQLQSAFAELHTTLRDDLLKRLQECSPGRFETLVLDVLVKMGYGGSLGEAMRVGRSGDGGIDGLIKADPLGLNQVYVQAKRWTRQCVGRPEVQGFVGALEGQGAHQGVFITTSDFTCEAVDYVQRLAQKRVILINGNQLTDYMIRFAVGVTARETFHLYDVDSDYFSEA